MPNPLNIFPVVLAGGSGSRLWPVSRRHNPKPFSISVNDESLFEATVKRLRPENGFEQLVILGARESRVMIEHGLNRASQTNAHVILEPVKRDTGPAVIAAALIASQKDPKSIVACFASDHFIADEKAFVKDVQRAAVIAEQGFITVLGVSPSEPNSRFGYISLGDSIDGYRDAYTISSFNEKPDIELAKQYIKKGDLWNSGNFVFRADVLLKEAALLAPEVLLQVERTLEASDLRTSYCCLDRKEYEKTPSISIDYAVMEKTANGAVIAGGFDWSDIGIWESVKNANACDENGNVIMGDAITRNVKSSYIHSDGSRLVGVTGLDNVIIVDQPDALLVCPADDGSSVKALFELMESRERNELYHSSIEHRPWGTFQTTFKGSGFQVKYLTVLPGGKLSLQKHEHRSEHWIIVAGVATVTIGGLSKKLGVGEHTFIPKGEAHRLSNETDSEVAVMEIQLGTKLLEDDIIRLEDVYDRT